MYRLWLTWLHLPKGTKDKVKRPKGPPTGSLLVEQLYPPGAQYALIPRIRFMASFETDKTTIFWNGQYNDISSVISPVCSLFAARCVFNVDVTQRKQKMQAPQFLCTITLQVGHTSYLSFFVCLFRRSLNCMPEICDKVTQGNPAIRKTLQELWMLSP